MDEDRVTRYNEPSQINGNLSNHVNNCFGSFRFHRLCWLWHLLGNDENDTHCVWLEAEQRSIKEKAYNNLVVCLFFWNLLGLRRVKLHQKLQ